MRCAAPLFATALYGCNASGHVDRAAPSASVAADAPSVANEAPSASPVGSYDAAKLAAYDPPTACVELCAAAMRCQADEIFGGGKRAVGYRLEHCRYLCLSKRIARPDSYLDDVRACLVSADCEAFQRCAGKLLPPNLGEKKSGAEGP
jgi:hypothetical protein